MLISFCFGGEHQDLKMKLKYTFKIAAKTENSAAKTSAARDKANTNASGDQGWSSSICIMVREYQIVD